MILRFFIFLILNFGALALGSYFTGSGVNSDWYYSLNKAPWTPPGWVFGFAWTSIMLCFSIYMTRLWSHDQIKRELILLYSFQWILNVSWNPIFFYFQKIGIGLLVIIALTILVGYFLFRFLPSTKLWSVWIMPYFIWLLIASSLNIYLFCYN
ncbi:MAG: tryptophan-rich sensory protein [Chitinophagales bacterium]|nr:tryptophan-rich sensory protein [Chitinophagales bacterium]